MEDNIPLEVKKERLQRLNAVLNDISLKKNKEYVGKVVEVLVEGESRKNADVLTGHTGSNKVVNFAGPKHLIGDIVKVRITDAKTWNLGGEWIEEKAEVAN
jgi:tRNA-2-methylthio-N6-dimethylallyladenosine synthase